MRTILLILFYLLFFDFGAAQNGKLVSKKMIDIRQTTIWNSISLNDTLLPEYRYLEKLDFFSITYKSGSLTVGGFLIEPKEMGKYPVIIFNRGGNRNFSPLTLTTMVTYTSKLAAHGYVIIGSNYREKDEFGGSELDDVLNLLETVGELGKVNSGFIGMFGWSRGGMMTYLALQKSVKIKTAVVGNGPTNLFMTISERPEMESKVFAECIPDYWTNKNCELKRRSVIYWFDKLCKSSSLLILCAAEDKNVNIEQAHKLAEKLKQIKYDYQLKEFDTDHFFSTRKNEMNEVLIDWFDKKLKNEQ